MAKKGNKSRKKQFDAYKSQNRYARNKVTKLIRVLSWNPNDKMAQMALQKYTKELGVK